jgi:hypothetical protein
VGVLKEVHGLSGELSNFSHVVIPNGDHFATGQRPYAWNVIRDWLLALP